MRLSNFGYLVGQGVKSVKSHKSMSLACIGVMIACLLLIGFAISLSWNVSSIMSHIEAQNELVAFVRDGVSDERCEELYQELSGLSNVLNVEYITKEQALENERESFGEMADLLDGLEEDNPLPASYRITLRDLSKLNDTLDKLGGYSELQEINAPVEISVTITTLRHVLFYAGAAIVGVLILVALVIISNTVELTIKSRQREISIMKFCGATNTFIRLPFLVEGTVVGLIAALVSYGIVYVLYERLIAWLVQSGGTTGFIQSMVDQLVPFSTIAIPLAVVFLAFGCLIGLLGSMLFVRKYLKV